MSVYMKPTSVIKARILGNGKAQKKLVNLSKRYMDKYVPFSNSSDSQLRINTEEIDNAVIYKSEYAHYQYKGILYVDPETGSSYAKKDTKKVPTSKKLKYHTPGTGSHWDKKMMSAEKDSLIKELQDYIDRGCK